MLQTVLFFLINYLAYIIGNNISLLAADEEKKAKKYSADLKTAILTIALALLLSNFQYYYLSVIIIYPLLLLLKKNNVITILSLGIAIYLFNLSSIILIIITSYFEGLQNSKTNKKSIKLDYKTLTYHVLVILLLLTIKLTQ